MTDPAPQIVITQGDVRRFLESCGYQLPRACPKCAFEPWDDAFDNPGGLFGTFAAGDIVPGRYAFSCPRCGYTENFDAAPLHNWMVKRHE